MTDAAAATDGRSAERDQPMVTLPPRLARDVLDALQGVVENRARYGSLDDDLAAAHELVFETVDRDQDEPVTLPRDTLAVASEWLEADINDHIETEGERPERLVDTHLRLEVALGNEAPKYSDDIMAAMDMESIMEGVSS